MIRKKIISFILLFSLSLTLVPTFEVSAARKGNTYIVEKGDSLTDIAKKYDLSWREIAKLNNLDKPYRIYVGEKLKLPKTDVQNKTDQTSKKKSNSKEEKQKEAAKKAAEEEKQKEAAKKAKEDASKDTNQQKAPEELKIYSDWAFFDLLEGDSYGIYPLTWYEDVLTGPVTKAKMEVLMKGFNDKLLAIDGVTTKEEYVPALKEKMTIEQVLNVFYSTISSNEYPSDIGLTTKYLPTDYMKEYGIFTGKNGERGIKETCSTEQALVFATRLITFIYDRLDAASKGFLWEVKHDNNTVYLLGSIHMANNDIYPFSNRMLEAYQKSDALVLEVNLYDTEGASEFVALTQYSDGTSLKDHVSKECYDQTIATAALLGISEAMINTCKPWYISNLFSSLSSSGTGDLIDTTTATSLGIDMSFMTNALYSGKPILEIEGYTKQGKIFDNFSDGLQEYLLINSIEELNGILSGTKKEQTENASLLNKWLDNWHDGDIDSFKKNYTMEDEFGDNFGAATDPKTKAYMDEYYEALLTHRDKGMADYIDNLLQKEDGKTYFVVVGSLHYLSDYSVLDMLTEKGYTITQIK